MPSCHAVRPYHIPQTAPLHSSQARRSPSAYTLHNAAQARRGDLAPPPSTLLLCSSLAGCARVSSRDVLEVLKVLLQQLVHRGDVVLEPGVHLLELLLEVE